MSNNVRINSKAFSSREGLNTELLTAIGQHVRPKDKVLNFTISKAKPNTSDLRWQRIQGGHGVDYCEVETDEV